MGRLGTACCSACERGHACASAPDRAFSQGLRGLTQRPWPAAASLRGGVGEWTAEEMTAGGGAVQGVIGAVGGIVGSIFGASAARYAAGQARKAATGVALIEAQTMREVAQGNRVTAVALAPVAVGMVTLLALVMILRR